MLVATPSSTIIIKNVSCHCQKFSGSGREGWTCPWPWGLWILLQPLRDVGFLQRFYNFAFTHHTLLPETQEIKWGVPLRDSDFIHILISLPSVSCVIEFFLLSLPIWKELPFYLLLSTFQREFGVKFFDQSWPTPALDF